MPGWCLRRRLPAVAAVAVLCLAPVARAETRVLVTGEWPPYTGVKEPQGGSMTAVVRAAFAAEGDDVRVGFFGWYRVQYLQEENREYAASFPHYYSEERARRCNFSDAIGESPLGLAELRSRAVEWRKTGDLSRYRIGTVKSYVNTPAFDQLVSAGRIRTLEALSDQENLGNLLAGKVDAAVIDRNVYAYLLSNNPPLRETASRLQLDPRVLIVHKLYMCFPKTEKGRILRDRFNHGLRTLQAPTP